MARIAVSGNSWADEHAETSVRRPYELPFAGVPILESFDFGRGGDANLWNFTVMPGGDAQLLDAGLDGPDLDVDPDTIYVNFHDDPDGELDVGVDFYSFDVSHTVVEREVATRYRVSGSGCRTSCNVNLPKLMSAGSTRPGLPDGGTGSTPARILALVGFQLQFSDRIDEPIRAIGVTIESNDHLSVMLDASEGVDREFEFIVDFASIAPVGRPVKQGIARGADEWHRFGLLPTVRRSELLLRGFNFFRPTGPDRIARVAVAHVDDTLQVRFDKEAAHNDYNWRVMWATLGRDQVA